MDLVFGISANLLVEGYSDIDQQLSQVQELRPILQKLEELKNIPIFDKAMQLEQQPG